MRLRAQWALPVSSPPIEDGEVVVEGSRIVEVRQRRANGSAVKDVRDFGEAVVMPGLVNVHSHVEYTVMRGLFDDLPFFPWIRRLTEMKARLEPDDWIASATLGVAEAVSGGVTTLGDCTDSGAALDGMAALGVRGVVYQEAFGIEDSVSVTQTVLDLDAKVRALTGRSDPNLHTIGVSPHSVYTVRPELMRAMATYAATNDLPVCIHAAESQAEVELVLRGTGEIADHFARRGIEWDTPRSSVVSYLDALGALGPRTLLVHGVNVSSRDRETIRSAGSAWAHCPRSNAKLGLGGAPLRWMTSRRDAGATGALPVAGRTPALRAGLGSDSVAGVNAMDMFEEMRFALLLQRALRREPDRPTAREMVRLVTIGGAEALGLGGTVGALVPGMQADIAVLSLRPARYHPVHDVWGAVALSGSARDVVFTTVAGQAVYDSRRGAGATIERAQRRVRHAAELLRVGAA